MPPKERGHLDCRARFRCSVGMALGVGEAHSKRERLDLRLTLNVQKGFAPSMMVFNYPNEG
jgi:hypothetical protein